MNSSVIILIFNFICTLAQIPHEVIYIVGCFKTDTQIQAEVDGEELMYADFQREKYEWIMPTFFGPFPMTLEEHFRTAVKNKRLCQVLLTFGAMLEKDPSETKDAPESCIYSRDDVEFGVENTLICFVNHFYPPSINVSWTKNDMEVAEGTSLSRYYPNNDGTFHQFSTLSFTPQEGDVYTCTVEHTGLEQHKTRIWESEVSGPSAGPDILCGVGLTLGMLGVAIGTFLFVKGHQRTEC